MDFIEEVFMIIIFCLALVLLYRGKEYDKLCRSTKWLELELNDQLRYCRN